MNLARARERIIAIRRDCDELLDELQEIEQGKAEALYMPPAEYAKRRRVTEATIRRWIKKGLPVARPPGSRLTQVKVEEADRWCDGSIERNAENAAHRGSRR